MLGNDLTLIITTYNDGEYLKHAINSALRQKCIPSEIIVVDDGSSDNGAQIIVEEIAKSNKFVNIIYIFQKNLGPSAARNTGVLNTKTKYLTFLDADDELTENSIGPRLDFLKYCGDEYFGVYGTGKTSKNQIINFIKYNDVPLPDLVGHFSTGIPGGSYFYIFTKNSITKAGLYDVTLRNNEDFDLIIRIARLGLKCAGPVCLSNFINIRKGSVSRTFNPMDVFKRTLEFLNKAEDFNYFTVEELNKRKKNAHLSCAKRLFYSDFNTACQLIKQGFSFSGPSSKKEKLLNILSSSIIVFKRFGKLLYLKF